MVKLRLIFLLSVVFIFSSCEDFLNPDPSTPAQKVKGTWNVAETSIEFGEQQYLVEFYPESNDSASVKIYNFFGLGSWSYVHAEISNRMLSIPTQIEEGYSILGTGTINEDFTEINLDFTVEEVVVPQKNVFAVSALFTKQ